MRSALSNSSVKTCPRVSVLMTIYNAGLYLEQAINSLINQSYKNWELIAVENGSDDNSASTLAQFYDDRIKVFPFPKNIGRTPALRFALEQARGEYIAVLDADDASYQERFIKQVTYLDDNPDVVLVSSGVEYIDEYSNKKSEWKCHNEPEQIYDCLGWMNPIIHSSVMYRTSIAKEVGGYPENYVYAQDFGLILLLVQKGKLVILPDILCKYRVLETSMTNIADLSIISVNENKKLLQQASHTLNLTSMSRYKFHRAIAVYDIKMGLALISDKKFIKGLLMVFQGFLRNPTALFYNGRFKSLCASLSRKINV